MLRLCLLLSTLTAAAPERTAAPAIPAEPATRVVSAEAVQEFISVRYIHGMPYGAAHDFGSGALPTLERILLDDSQKALWVNVITMMAFVGDERSFPQLQAFVWDRFTGEVDLETFQALIAAQQMIGYVAGADEARTTRVHRLAAGVDPAHWRALPWRFRQYQGEVLETLSSKLAINALSVTGHPVATTLLSSLAEQPFHPTQVANVVEGLERLGRIEAESLDGFMRRIDREVAAQYAPSTRAQASQSEGGL